MLEQLWNLFDDFVMGNNGMLLRDMSEEVEVKKKRGVVMAGSPSSDIAPTCQPFSTSSCCSFCGLTKRLLADPLENMKWWTDGGSGYRTRSSCASGVSGVRGASGSTLTKGMFVECSQCCSGSGKEEGHKGRHRLYLDNATSLQGRLEIKRTRDNLARLTASIHGGSSSLSSALAPSPAAPSSGSCGTGAVAACAAQLSFLQLEQRQRPVHGLPAA